MSNSPIHTRLLAESMIRQWTGQIARNPRDYEALTAIASAHGMLGRYEQALEFASRAVAIEAKHAPAHLIMASAYGHLGRTKDKIASCKVAVSLAPGDAEAHGNLGAALGKAGHFEEAIDALNRAISLKPNLPDARLALGVAYLSTGDTESAIDQALALDRMMPELGKELRHLIDMVFSHLIANADLALTREEISAFLRMMQSEAKADGGSYFFKAEVALAIEAFQGDPTPSNALELLWHVPVFRSYFEMCSPGGSAYLLDELANHLDEDDDFDDEGAAKT